MRSPSQTSAYRPVPFIRPQSKVLPTTGHEGPDGEQMYSSTLPSASELDGGGGQHHAPAAQPPGKDPERIV